MPSTVIAKIEYDQDSKVLIVLFQSGKTYYYKNVPKKIYTALKYSGSKGSYLNKYIKGNFEYESSDFQ